MGLELYRRATNLSSTTPPRAELWRRRRGAAARQPGRSCCGGTEVRVALRPWRSYGGGAEVQQHGGQDGALAAARRCGSTAVMAKLWRRHGEI